MIFLKRITVFLKRTTKNLGKNGYYDLVKDYRIEERMAQKLL